MTAPSSPTCASCAAPLPTRLVSSPIDGERFLLREVVDVDAWRAHLLEAHPVRRPALRGVA